MTTMTWTPNCTEAPYYWTLGTPIGFGVTYQVILSSRDGFMPMRLAYTKRDPQEERLSNKRFEILADAMKVCEDAYLQDTDRVCSECGGG